VRAIAAGLGLALVGAGLATAGCGGGPTSLNVTVGLYQGQPATIGPGQIASFTITVTDTGAAGTGGLTIAAQLPADFRFKDTETLGGTAVRTSPVDPQGNSQQPT